MYYNNQYNKSYSTAAKFLTTLSPGTPGVRFHFDGGGLAGFWVGTYQGIDEQGNAIFSGVTNVSVPTTAIPGLFRVSLRSIDSVSI